MTARYFARERIFRGKSPNLPTWTAVFATNDLSDEEAQTLQKSVQEHLAAIEKSGQLYEFDLGPSAEDDPAAFIALKHDWDRRKKQIEEFGESSGNCWQAEVHFLYTVTSEHAELIRGLRKNACPSVILQCRLPDGKYSSFAHVNSLTDSELKLLEEVLSLELERVATTLRIITDSHATNEPHEYILAKLDYERYSDPDSTANENGHDYEYEMASDAAFDRCLAEIKRLRTRSAYSGMKKTPLAGNNISVKPSEEHRAKYCDRSNYWRNVWLYEQRQIGKTGVAILAELRVHPSNYAPLNSENALRTAIKTIAMHHGWPILKGTPGRPKTSTPLP